jgi:hypothetical protein
MVINGSKIKNPSIKGFLLLNYVMVNYLTVIVFSTLFPSSNFIIPTPDFVK